MNVRARHGIRKRDARQPPLDPVAGDAAVESEADGGAAVDAGVAGADGIGAVVAGAAVLAAGIGNVATASIFGLSQLPVTR